METPILELKNISVIAKDKTVLKNINVNYSVTSNRVVHVLIFLV